MKKYIFLTVLLSGLLATLLGSGSVGAAARWQVTYAQEFNDVAVPSDWNIRQVQNHLGTHMSFNENGLSAGGGSLVITTTRHCVSSETEKLDASNASESPCPTGKITKYLSGRLMSDKVVDGSKPFRVEIRAKINWNGLKGMRPSLWMRNTQELDSCKTDPAANLPYGELDILEWYSHMPAYTWSSSHISCFYSSSQNTWRTRNFGHHLEHRPNRRPASLAGDWHVWAVEYDGEKVSYFVDGELVVVDHYTSSDTNTVKTIDSTPGAVDEKGRVISTMPNEDFSKLGISSGLIKKVFDDKWYIILNDYVESKPGMNPPSPTERFPAQTLLVDYVRVYGRVDSAAAHSGEAQNSHKAGGSVAARSSAMAAKNTKQLSTATSGRLAETGDDVYMITATTGFTALIGGWFLRRKSI